MCAVLASYATYSLLDWPGISTAVTTCFFVSLTTVGESVHKLTLRLSGAAIGGLIAGLCIVFVLPSLTDIGQLCLLVAAVSFFCAWIATSSETIAYAGMQIAFAFFLGVLQGYGPGTDLTQLRDRLVGIVLGNVWITIFFTTLWPVSAAGQACDKWLATFKQLGELLIAKDEATVTSMKAAICKQASEAGALNSRARFERRFLARANPADRPIPEAAQAERLAAAAFVVVRLKQSAALLSVDAAADELASQRLIALSKKASTVRSGEPPGPSPTTLLLQARQRLDEEIDHASRTI
jgi:multidrug resistance protein MdtO